MSAIKLTHRINRFFYLFTLLLYFTVYLGMLFQMVLGFVQLMLAVKMSIDHKDYSQSTIIRLKKYWSYVACSCILMFLTFFYGDDIGNSVTFFVIPMLIATYFYYTTANINNDSFLNAAWKNLAILNYEVNPKILENHIPNGTELDLWNGKCYVSVVGFMFEDVKLLGFKIPFHRNFEEVNLRFYVKRFEDNEWKRGVVFIKEIVPKLALSTVANKVYKENYKTHPMKHAVIENEDSNQFAYQWKIDNKWNSITIETEKNLQEITINSEAEFITEHYFGYTKIDGNKTFEYEVKHPRWQQLKVVNFDIDIHFESTYGSDFAFLKDLKPCSVFLAKGSEVSVENKKTITS